MALVQDFEPIWITHMVDPTTFWFVGAADQAIRLEKELQLNAALKNTDIQESYQPGELVAVRSVDGAWQRGEVQTCVGIRAGSYFIFLLDHGTTRNAQTANIRKLPAEFCSDFHASRFRLHGLKVRVKDKAQLTRVIKSKLIWPSETYDMVADLLRAASACFMDTNSSRLHRAGNTFFGELTLEVHGDRINLNNEIVRQKFAVLDADKRNEERRLLTDPLGWALGSTLSEQVSNVMLKQMQEFESKMPVFKSSEDGEVDVLCGRGMTRPSRAPSAPTPSSSSTASTSSSSTLSEAETIKFHPAGIDISRKVAPMESKPSRRTQLLQQKLNLSPLQSGDNLADRPAVRVASSPGLSSPGEDLNTTPPRSKRTQMLFEKLRVTSPPQDIDWRASGDATASGPLTTTPGSMPTASAGELLNAAPSSNAETNSSPAQSAEDFRFQTQQSLPPSPSGSVPEMLTMDHIIVHARTGRPEPIQSCREATFPEAIHKVVEKQRGPSRLQRYAWPAILRGENVLMVEPPDDSILTAAFLVPLLGLLMDKPSYAQLPPGSGPIALIIVAEAQYGEKILQECNRFKDPRNPVRVLLTHGGGAETEKKTALANGCDILITTPLCLVRLLDISTTLIPLNRLCHLVLDHAHILLGKFQREVNGILNLCKEAKRRQSMKRETKPLQVISGSEEWSLMLYTLVHDITPYPLVLIDSFTEAAIYANVHPRLDILAIAAKPDRILRILSGQGANKVKTVVACSDKVDAINIKRFVDHHEFKALLAHEGLSRAQLDDVRVAWNAGRTLLLICTDVILPDLLIDDALCLIHYNMPLMKTPFGTRFTCLMKNFPNINKAFDRTAPVCDVYILYDDVSRKQLPGVVTFMERLSANVQQGLKSAAQVLKEQLEREKVDVPLCSSLKAFGACKIPNSSTACKERHAIIPTDHPVNLPKSGRVKLKVVSVLNASRFSARLLEVTHLDGTREKIEDDYLTIAMELALHFNRPANHIPHAGARVGHLVAVETKLNLFQRARVSAITARDKVGVAKEVKVHLLDAGIDMSCSATKLMHLPDHLRDLPAQVVEVFLCSVLPLDMESTWSLVAYNQVLKWIEDVDRNERFGSYVVGDIKLSLANSLWLDPMHIKRSLPTLATDVTAVALQRKLIDSEMAVSNPQHLPQLYELCRRGDMEIPVFMLPREPQETSAQMTPVARPRWAHLWEEASHGVTFLAADNPNQLFVRQHEFETNLKQLTTWIQKHMAERGTVGNVRGISEGLVCLAKTPEPPVNDGKWHRAIVTGVTEDNLIEVFFVDHGDRATVDAETNVAPIEDRFITYLPFQAIECRLAGIRLLDEESTEKAIDRMYDLTLDADNFLIIYNFHILSKDESAEVTGGRKYSLALLNPDAKDEAVLNRMLIEEGLVGWNPDEEEYLRGVNVKREEVVKLADLEGVSLHTNETQDTVLGPDETCFDIEIDDVQRFLFNMCQGKALEALAIAQAPAVPAILHDTAAIAPAAARAPSGAAQAPSAVTIAPADDDSDEDEGDTEDCGRKPHVTWHQDLDHVHIDVELVDIKVYHVDVEPMTVSFKAGEYGVGMNLFGAVLPENTEHFSTGRRICIKLLKMYRGMWLHLLRKPDRSYYWLKYNIEHADDGEVKPTPLSPEAAAACTANTLQREGIVADFQYNDSDSESDNSDYVEDDKPYVPIDYYDPLN